MLVIWGKMERALLITLKIKNKSGSWSAEERTTELEELATSSGAEVRGTMIVARDRPSPAYFIGKGKTEEISEICAEKEIDVVIFNNDLTGTQQKNLEEIVNVKIIDRTQLILDIFARRAKSNDGKIQVELAQLLYLMPRLTGRGILLSRLGGGIGTRGPGEQKLEVDRRRIRDRITKLKRDLAKLSLQRATRRKQRTKFSLLTIAIIGYTNCGKSTLLNALTESRVYTRDRLFSTLDPTIRSFILPNNQKVLFVDTVGFLNELPHHLIESFKATLEEVVNADILLHLVDVSYPKAKEMERAVFDVLGELNAADKPVITVLNKIDKISDNEIKRFIKEFRDAIAISALKKQNFGELIDRIVLHLNSIVKIYRISLPQNKARLISLIHERGHVLKREYRGDMVYLEAQIPTSLYDRIKKEIRF